MSEKREIDIKAKVDELQAEIREMRARIGFLQAMIGGYRDMCSHPVTERGCATGELYTRCVICGKEL